MSWSRRGALAGLGALSFAGCISELGTKLIPPWPPDKTPVRLPALVVHRLTTGAQLYLIEDHAVPLVAAAVAIRSGFRHDSAGCEGLADLVGRILLEGGGDRAKLELLERYGDLGATPELIVNDSMLGLRCTVHRDDAPAALSLMVETLRRAAAMDTSFEQLRTAQLEALEASRGRPELIAAHGVILGSYGIEPPAATLASGSVKTVAGLEIDMVHRWLATHLRADRLCFMLAGDTSLEQALEWIIVAGNDWSVDPQAPELSEPALPSPGSPRLRSVFVPWSDIPRAMLAYGGPIAEYGAATEFAEGFARSIFTGLLQYELRDVARLSYGIRTKIWSTRRGPVSQQWTSLANHDLPRALQRLRVIALKLDQDSGQTSMLAEKALPDLQRASLVEMMSALDGPDAILVQLLELARLQLPASTLQDRVDALLRVDAEQVANQLRRVFNPNLMRVCAVATATTIGSARKVQREDMSIIRSPTQLLGA